MQGEYSGDSDEVGPLVLGYTDFSTPDALVTLFGSTLPTTVGALVVLCCSFLVKDFLLPAEVRLMPLRFSY